MQEATNISALKIKFPPLIDVDAWFLFEKQEMIILLKPAVCNNS